MNKLLLTFLLLNLNLQYCVSQDLIYAEYWLKNKSEKEQFEKEQFEKYGIISLDSISIEKIRFFMIEKGEILPVPKLIHTIFSPFMYQIKPLISDSLNSKGIYRIKFTSSHSNVFLVFKNEESLFFYEEIIGRNELVIKILNFLNEHDDDFTTTSKTLVWKNLSFFLQETNNISAAARILSCGFIAKETKTTPARRSVSLRRSKRGILPQ